MLESENKPTKPKLEGNKRTRFHHYHRHFGRFGQGHGKSCFLRIKHSIRPLTELKKGSQAKIMFFRGLDGDTIRKIEARGLHKGCIIMRKNNSTPLIVEACGTEIAIGANMANHIMVSTTQKVIFLMGNPNVGKSTIFSRLTGVKTEASNYPGTTVSLLNGETEINKNLYTVYDMPGIYSLESAPSRAEAQSCNLIKNTPYDIAVYIADAEHLERNLFCALETMALKKPFVLVLNKFDTAAKKGINIDIKNLSKLLGVPVLAVEGLTGTGLKELTILIDKIVSGRVVLSCPQVPQTDEDKWKLIGRVSQLAQKIVHRHPTFLETIEEAASSLWLGLPMAGLTLILSFIFIMFCGEKINAALSPLYDNYYLPLVQNLFDGLPYFLKTILIGGGTYGDFGILTDALKIAFIDVLPYVIIFYTVLGFLSDLGYLPRIAILLDKFLHKIGLHGYGVIPIMLGLGCKVPAIMAARTLESKRQKLIALALILLSVPCISQTTMMFSVVAPYGLKYLLLIFGYMLVIGILVGYVLNKILPGDTPDIFMEVPTWHLPKLSVFFRNIWQHIKAYIVEAVPLIILGVLLISLAQEVGLIDLVDKLMRAPLAFILGLPQEAGPVVLLGFFRKDISIALLSPFGLSATQMVSACVFMAMYLPCTASLFVLFKEVGFKDTLKIITLTFMVACLAGFLLKIIL